MTHLQCALFRCTSTGRNAIGMKCVVDLFMSVIVTWWVHTAILKEDSDMEFVAKKVSKD
jgi:hypothetical protein